MQKKQIPVFAISVGLAIVFLSVFLVLDFSLSVSFCRLKKRLQGDSSPTFMQVYPPTHNKCI